MKYTPILQSKEGEFEALSTLLHSMKTQITPLIQLLPDNKASRVGDYVSKKVNSIANAWAHLDNRLYLDAQQLSQVDIGVTQRFFHELKDARVNIIPVVHPNTSQEQLSIFSSYTLHGLCLRVKADEIDSYVINRSISRFCAYFGVETSEIDLILDFGYIGDGNVVGHLVNSLVGVIASIDTVKALRNVIISSGSFPPDLSNILKDTIVPLTRHEWILWNRAKARVGSIRPVVYADYGNVNPVYRPEQAQRQGSCSIKYTDVDSFYIFKGVRASDHKDSTGQYKTKAEQLVTKPYYAGPTYSWGDQYIQDCVDGREPPSSAQRWVKVTQNHHFTMMLNLLS